MKRIGLNLKIALRSLYSFKLRTALAVLGVFLGTFSLILVSNLTDSLARKAEQELDKLGKNLLVVRSGTAYKFAAGARLLSEATSLTLGDAGTLLEECPAVKNVCPSFFKYLPVRCGSVTLSSILVTAASPNYPELRNFYPAVGCFFTSEENESLSRVVVLGKRVASKLFGNGNPIGKHILVSGIPCQVIGVMEEKGADISNIDQDNQIFIPLKTFLRRFLNKEFINTIYVRTTSQESMAQARSQIESALRESHKIGFGKKEDFMIVDMKDIMKLKTRSVSMISTLGRICAAVSFSIGALGILSIMILIVNERRVEIGIRRAVGSRKRDIVLQFLLESSFISFGGGMVGVAFGFLVSAIVFSLSGLPFTISPAGIVFSFAASVAVGILAGIYPSSKAVTVQPVDVIRS